MPIAEPRPGPDADDAPARPTAHRVPRSPSQDPRLDEASRRVEQHYALVRKVCRARLRNAADAEDAAQDVMLKWVAHAGEIHGEPAHWLTRCARNTCVDRLRSSTRRTARERAAENQHDDAHSHHEQARIDRRELAQQLLLRLDPADAELLVQHAVRATPQRELAHARGVSQQAVAARIGRIKRRLREAFPELTTQGPLSAATWGGWVEFVRWGAVGLASALRGALAGSVSGPVWKTTASSGAAALLLVADTPPPEPRDPTPTAVVATTTVAATAVAFDPPTPGDADRNAASASFRGASRWTRTPWRSHAPNHSLRPDARAASTTSAGSPTNTTLILRYPHRPSLPTIPATYADAAPSANHTHFRRPASARRTTRRTAASPADEPRTAPPFAALRGLHAVGRPTDIDEQARLRFAASLARLFQTPISFRREASQAGEAQRIFRSDGHDAFTVTFFPATAPRSALLFGTPAIRRASDAPRPADRLDALFQITSSSESPRTADPRIASFDLGVRVHTTVAFTGFDLDNFASPSSPLPPIDTQPAPTPNPVITEFTLDSIAVAPTTPTRPAAITGRIDTPIYNTGDLALADARVAAPFKSPRGSRVFLDGVTVFEGPTSGAGHLFGGGTAVYAGLHSPGDSPAWVAIDGDVVYTPDSRLLLELAGLGAEQFDALHVAGDVTLAGVLDLALLDGFTPAPGDRFRVIEAGGLLTGRFANYNEGDLIALPGLADVSLAVTYQALGGSAVEFFAVPTPRLPFTAVPEPTAAALTLGLTLAGLATTGRRRRIPPPYPRQDSNLQPAD